jgi:hypothetical protein
MPLLRPQKRASAAAEVNFWRDAFLFPGKRTVLLHRSLAQSVFRFSGGRRGKKNILGHSGPDFYPSLMKSVLLM